MTDRLNLTSEPRISHILFMSSGRQIAGLPERTPEKTYHAKLPPAALVQRVAYDLSDAVFSFNAPVFDLDFGLSDWSNTKRPNSAGEVPFVTSLEVRIGAGSALLGYLSEAENKTRASVLATTGAFRLMEPVLAARTSELSRSKVAFHVAAVDYDIISGTIVADDARIYNSARNLGIPAVTSNLYSQDDFYNTSVLTSIISQSLGPIVHVYDGLRGSRQAVHSLVSESLPKTLPSVGSIHQAFSETNALLKTNLAPFEYSGPAEPSVVLVSLGLPAVFAGYNGVGAVNVRLYSPFLTEEFWKVVPTTASRLVVVGKSPDLYKDVSAACATRFGLRNGPEISKLLINPAEELTPMTIADFLGVSAPSSPTAIKVWDSDKSGTAAAAGSLSLSPLEPTPTTYAVFDNCLNAGTVQTDLWFVDNKEFTPWWPVKSAGSVVVADQSLLKLLDVTATAQPGAVIVVNVGSADEIPPAAKLALLNSKARVYSASLPNSDAVQALIWHLADSKLNLDQITTRLVQSNGNQKELVAAEVHKVVEGAIESLTELKLEVPADIADKDKTNLLEDLSCTSFYPAPSFSDEPSADAGVEELSKNDLVQRFVFPEAFNAHTELRPDVAGKTYIAKVKTNQAVTPENYDRYIFHIELDISGTGLRYGIGEALGIHAPNNETAVLEFMDWYGISQTEIVAAPSRENPQIYEYKTAFQALRDNFDLFGKVPKRFYEGLAPYATDEKQRKHLEKLASTNGTPELKKRSDEWTLNYVDTLHEFHSAHPPLDKLLELISPLKRREYSIASSQKVHPNEVHLLIVVVDWKAKDGTIRYGQCSKFLADLQRGAEVVVSVKPSVMKLPSDPAVPIIMAGLGTGLAPFKAFLEEKMWQREQGHDVGNVYLFLGSRHQREEYLYGEQFEAFKAAGILTHIGAAFSRDQPEKIYIQHRIKQAKKELIDAFVKKNGTFYLCGPTWPVPDISEALTDIVVSEAIARDATVDEDKLIEDLKDTERYILEVY